MSARCDYIGMAADIVCAFVANNDLNPSELAGLIRQVHGALSERANGPDSAPGADLVPAVSIRKSVTPDYIVCLEDGKRFKSLRRHIGAHYGLTPDDYRKKWGLPHDYPMVAPNYAKTRSALARRMGLGRTPQQAKRR